MRAMTESIPSEFEVLDDRFRTCRGDPRVERLYGDCRWAEGPVYAPGGRYVIWSDIPNDRMLRWDEPTGQVGVFRHPAGYTNGNTLDAQGRLISCEHGGRRVSRTEHDGSISTIADRIDGKRLNSPNDVVVRSDGSIWFTDPAYGIDSDYEGHQAESEIGSCNVYRIDPISGEIMIVADDFARPNGLAFSQDETALYVTDSEVGHMRVFAVNGDGGLTDARVFAECSAGVFDGIRLDTQGRVWGAAGDGVHCLDPDGTLLGKLRLPEPASNLVFGGLKRNRLFVTASTSLYSLMLNVNGAR
jgi:gluconolactonase